MQQNQYPQSQLMGQGNSAFGPHSGLVINGSLFSGIGGGTAVMGSNFIGNAMQPAHQGPRGVSPYSGTR